MSSSIRLVVGSLLSVAGVALVAMNGIVNFHLRPLGDMMALGAMVSWGGYSVLIDKACELRVDLRLLHDRRARQQQKEQEQRNEAFEHMCLRSGVYRE